MAAGANSQNILHRITAPNLNSQDPVIAEEMAKIREDPRLYVPSKHDDPTVKLRESANDGNFNGADGYWFYIWDVSRVPAESAHRQQGVQWQLAENSEAFKVIPFLMSIDGDQVLSVFTTSSSELVQKAFGDICEENGYSRHAAMRIFSSVIGNGPLDSASRGFYLRNFPSWGTVHELASLLMPRVKKMMSVFLKGEMMPINMKNTGSLMLFYDPGQDPQSQVKFYLRTLTESGQEFPNEFIELRVRRGTGSESSALAVAFQHSLAWYTVHWGFRPERPQDGIHKSNRARSQAVAAANHPCVAPKVRAAIAHSDSSVVSQLD